MAKDNPVNGAEPDNNPVGRPLKYKTVEELDRAINAYFDMCDPHTQRRVVDCGINEKGETIWREREVMTEQKPYTMAGLARAIGLSRQSLLNYKNRDEFLDSIVDAKARCEEFWEGRLDSRHDRGAAFNLTNNYDGWRNRQEVTGKDGEDLGKGWADMLALASKVAEADGENADGDGRTDTPAS
jgi:hypothetical protein